jgi:hypothetical protein
MFIAPRRCGLAHSSGVQCFSFMRVHPGESWHAQTYMALLRSATFRGTLAINISLLRSEDLSFASL